MDNNETDVCSEQSLNTTTKESNNPESLMENPTFAEVSSIDGELFGQVLLKRKMETTDSGENYKPCQAVENQLSSEHYMAEKKIRMHDDSGSEPYLSKAESRNLSGAQKRKLLKARLKERGKVFDPNWRIRTKILKELDQGSESKPNTSPGSITKVQAESSNQSIIEKTEQGNKITPDDEPMERVNDIITSIRMAVIHCNYPRRKISEKEGRKIQFSLIDQFVPLADGIFPQFIGCYIEKGVLVVACSNKETVLWLEEMVPYIQLPDSPGLVVRERSTVLWGTKIMFKAPSHLVNQYHDQVLDILGNQNKPFLVSQWKTIGKRTDHSGKTFICLVDNIALEAIVFEGYKAFLGLEQISIKVLLK